jgi:hypothetical protein
MSLCACGRLGFDGASTAGGDDDAGVRIDARADANVCLSSTVDVPSWPIPNDRPGLPRQRSLTVMGERVVDNITGLEWQRTLSSGPLSWQEAVDYCATLDLDGGCWRMPERIELASIVDYSVHTPSSPSTFSGTPAGEFWTRTTFMPAPANRWIVRFDVGYLLDRDASGSSYVRCVRGAQELSTTRFAVTADTVRDMNTGLEWQRVVGGSYMWAEAQDYCAQLATDGGGWRSPSIQELETIVDTTKAGGVVIDDVAFPSTPASMFWSGNEIQNDASQGWTIDFTAGYSFRPITTGLPTRCVR